MRNLTKESRLNSQRVQFDSLIKQGFTHEIYKGLNIFTIDRDGGKFSMKVFKDSAANHFAYFYYRTAERREEAKQEYKNNYDRWQVRKAEDKANPRKTMAANCSAAIKTELKLKFPSFKFSVTCDNFAGGNSVDIRWEDGPTESAVSDITCKYQYGHFNGMEDLYEYTNSRDDIPQAKYVHCHRDISEATKAAILPHAEKIWDQEENNWNCHHIDNFIYRIFQAYSIPAGATITGIVSTGATCGGGASPQDFYKPSFDLSDVKEVEPITPVPNVEKIEVTPGTVQVIEYGQGLAVVGDTRPIKDKLKALGGRFNFRLTCGAGWVFKKSDLEKLQKALTTSDLKDEINKTLDFFQETDLKLYGEVTPSTLNAIHTQNHV